MSLPENPLRALAFKSFYLNSASSKNLLEFGVYGGRFQIALRVGENGQPPSYNGKPTVARFFDWEVKQVILHNLKALEAPTTAGKDTRFSMVIRKFDRDTKEKKVDFGLVLGKDEKGIYYAEFNFPDNKYGKERFNFACRTDITVGSDALTAVLGSEFSHNEFVNFLTMAAEPKLTLSNLKREIPSSGSYSGPSSKASDPDFA